MLRLILHSFLRHKAESVCMVGLFWLFGGLLHCSSRSADSVNLSSLSDSAMARAVHIQSAFNEVFADVSPAVVAIYTEKSRDVRNPFFAPQFGPLFGPPSLKRKSRGLGSGFVVESEGYIVTNYHVTRNVDKIVVRMYDGNNYQAKVIGSDPNTDIALLKVDHTGLPTVKIGDSDTVKVGDWAIAVGNPFGLTHTFTVGVVSARARENIGGNEVASYIQTDASINPGNSGGPLLNIRGEVVGLNRMIYSKTGGSVGIGFAIPINYAMTVVEELKENKRGNRAWLGVAVINWNPQAFRSSGTAVNKRSGGKLQKAVIVTRVYEGSPAARVRLQRGDIIFQANSTRIRNYSDLKEFIKKTPVGRQVRLRLFRRGSLRSAILRLDAQP